MEFEYVPLLETQRKLCDIPRGSERFEQYIATLRGDTFDDMAVPLSAFNPMGKQHVADLLDAYLAMDADSLAASALLGISDELPTSETRWKIALVLADDAEGGWTNRYATEFDHRYKGKANYRRGWTIGMLWTSESADEERVRIEVRAALARAVHVAAHGHASTLGEMLDQSGFVAAIAKVRSQEMDEEEAEYTRQIIQPYLESESKAVQIACLFGDSAADQLGYERFGLCERAGLRLAAQQRGEPKWSTT